ELVAVVAGEEGAQWEEEQADYDRRESDPVRQRRASGAEEEFVEDQSCSRCVEEVVVPLDARAYDRCERQPGLGVLLCCHVFCVLSCVCVSSGHLRCVLDYLFSGTVSYTICGEANRNEV